MFFFFLLQSLGGTYFWFTRPAGEEAVSLALNPHHSLFAAFTTKV